MDGETGKKQASNSLTRKLDKVEKEGVTIEKVGSNYTCLNYDITGKEFIAAANAGEVMDKLRKDYNNAPYRSAEKDAIYEEMQQVKVLQSMLSYNYFGSGNKRYQDAIAKGLLMGQLLGRKIQKNR
jgi:hypothetical protein